MDETEGVNSCESSATNATNLYQESVDNGVELLIFHWQQQYPGSLTLQTEMTRVAESGSLQSACP